MSLILKVVAAFVVAVILSEFLLLSGRKIQSRLLGIFVVQSVLFFLTFIFIIPGGTIGIISLAIFWLGAFLSWFGVRSHLESSILLRMLYLLKFRPMKPGELLEQYEKHYGEALRIEELIHSALIRREAERFTLTRKGRWILNAAARLK
jgi:hypothetical protein